MDTNQLQKPFHSNKHNFHNGPWRPHFIPCQKKKGTSNALNAGHETQELRWSALHRLMVSAAAESRVQEEDKELNDDRACLSRCCPTREKVEKL